MVTCQDVLCSRSQWTGHGPFDGYIFMVVVHGFDATWHAAYKTTFQFPRARAPLRTIRTLLYALFISQNDKRFMNRGKKVVNDVSDFVGDCVSILMATEPQISTTFCSS